MRTALPPKNPEIKSTFIPAAGTKSSICLRGKSFNERDKCNVYIVGTNIHPKNTNVWVGRHCDLKTYENYF